MSKKLAVSQNRERSLANLKPFEKGISGNPGGRPKLLTGAYKAMLAEVDERTGKTKAEMIAESLAKAAQQEMLPHSVSAAKELRQATEGGADVQVNVANFYDIEMAQELGRLAEKRAEAKVLDNPE